MSSVEKLIESYNRETDPNSYHLITITNTNKNLSVPNGAYTIISVTRDNVTITISH